MQFEVRWFDAGQARVRVTVVEAPDAAAARLAAGAACVLSARRLGAPARGAPRLDVGWWCEEMRTLTQAGMTVAETLEALRAAARDAAHAAVLDRMAAALARGLPLSQAMAAEGVFPPLLVAGVRAGEKTGGLAAALDDYLRFHRITQALGQRVAAAAIYPALVLALGLLITLLLLVVVVPRFASMYAGLDKPVSAPTQALLWLSDALRTGGGWWLIGGGLAVAWGVQAWRAGRGRATLAALLERIGPLRRLLREYRLAQLYRSLALLLRGGWVLEQALGLGASLPLGPALRRGLQVAASQLRAGGAVAPSFAAGGLTDAVTLRLLTVGERAGSFDRVLQTIAERHAAKFEVSLERITRIVEPLLLFLVSILVGALVLLLYMPVFEMVA